MVVETLPKIVHDLRISLSGSLLYFAYCSLLALGKKSNFFM